MHDLSKYARLPKGKIPLSIALGFASAGFIIYMGRLIRSTLHRPASKTATSGIKISPIKKTEKVSVDLKFLRNVLKLLRIAIPGFFTMEMFYLIVVAIALVARTYSDLWIITNGTAIESSIIDRNPAKMKRNVSYRYLIY